MSQLIDFPKSTIPHDARSSVIALFGIRGLDITADLPPQIPLTVVLHFAPKLKQWVLLPPLTFCLPSAIVRLQLRSPHIGIDIQSDDVKAPGLKWIIVKMLQVAGLPRTKELFLSRPGILTCISIYRTWLALDLPVAGTQNLRTYIQTQLMSCPAVTLLEIDALWNAFPRDSDIMRLVGLNFINSHINFDYSHLEFLAIREWYLQSEEQSRFFRSLEDHFLTAGAMQGTGYKASGARITMDDKDQVKAETSKTKRLGSATAQKALETCTKLKRLLEKSGTRTVSLEEKEQRQAKDGEAMRSRLRKTKSDDSIRSVETVVWNPEEHNVEVQEVISDETPDTNATVTDSGHWDAAPQPKAEVEGVTKVTIARDELLKSIYHDRSRNSTFGKNFATIRKRSGREELKLELAKKEMNMKQNRTAE